MNAEQVLAAARAQVALSERARALDARRRSLERLLQQRVGCLAYQWDNEPGTRLCQRPPAYVVLVYSANRRVGDIFYTCQHHRPDYYRHAQATAEVTGHQWTFLLIGGRP